MGAPAAGCPSGACPSGTCNRWYPDPDHEFEDVWVGPDCSPSFLIRLPAGATGCSCACCMPWNHTAHAIACMVLLPSAVQQAATTTSQTWACNKARHAARVAPAVCLVLDGLLTYHAVYGAHAGRSCARPHRIDLWQIALQETIDRCMSACTDQLHMHIQHVSHPAW